MKFRKKKGGKKNIKLIFLMIILIILILSLSLFYLAGKYGGVLDGELPSSGIWESIFSFFKFKDVFLLEEFLCPPGKDFTYPESIVPRPQNIEMLDCINSVIVDNNWKIYADLSGRDNFSAQYLKDYIFQNASIDLDVLDLAYLSPNKRIIIGNPNENLALNQIAVNNNIDVNLNNKFNQGYVLLIKDDEILIFANSSQGSFYGMISLLWLLKQDLGTIKLPSAKIIDWPDLEIRGFYGSGAWNWNENNIVSGGVSGGEKWIDILAYYKYNLWHAGLGSKLLPNPSQESINAILAREKFLKDRHFYTSISLLPFFVSDYNKNLYEGIWVQNLSARFNESDFLEINKTFFNISNSGFEDDINANNIPDFWHMSPSTAGFGYDINNWSMNCTEARPGSDGSCSVKLTLLQELPETASSAALTSGESYLEQYIDLEPNKVYQFSVWAKLNDLELPRIGQTQLTFVMTNKTGSVMYPKSVVFNDAGNNTWEKYTSSFSTYNGEDSMYIYLRAQSSNALELWIDDIKLQKVDDMAINIIETDDSELEIWNKDKTIKYLRNLDYILDYIGEINATEPLQGRVLKVERVDSGNIPANSSVLLDFDFIPKMQQSRAEYFSFSEPETYLVYMNKIAKPTLDVLSPDFVFIGMDEIRGMNRDSRSRKRGLENYELLAYAVSNFSDIIHLFDEDINILIWDDMFNPLHSGAVENGQMIYGGILGKTWYALDLFDRSSLYPIIWIYKTPDYYKKLRGSPVLFNAYGFDFFGGPGSLETADYKNKRWWSYISYKNNALGIIEHEYSNNVEGIPYMANYSWNAIKEYSAECNPDYAEICDGIDNDCDNVYGLYQNQVWESNVDEDFNLSSDIFNCGSCENVCYYPKGFASCVNGICNFDGCFRNYYNVNNDLIDGCECLITNNGVEICDGLDNDCDGIINNGLNCGSPSSSGNNNGETSGSNYSVPIIQNKTNEGDSIYEEDNEGNLLNETFNQTEIPYNKSISKPLKIYLGIIGIFIVLIIIVLVLFFIVYFKRKKRIESLVLKNVQYDN